MEEVIHEVKVIETEDGFRIEIKGDKERLRKFVENIPFGFGMPFGFRAGFRGGRRHEKGHRRHGRHRHGPRRDFMFFVGDDEPPFQDV